MGEMSIPDKRNRMWQVSEVREKFHMSVRECKRIARGENKEAETGI